MDRSYELSSREVGHRSVLRRRSTALAVGLVGALAADIAVAAPCQVPTVTHPTIQSAVNDVACDPIVVAAGTYVENVSINRSLSLRGAQAGVDARNRTGAESIIQGNPTIDILAPNVFVDGFTITGLVGNSSSNGIVIRASGTVVTNNIFDDINGVTTTAQAIAVYRGPDGIVIAHNLIRNVSSPNAAKGIFVEDTASTDPSILVLIEGNEISNVTSTTRGGYGILVNNGGGNTKNAYLKIKDNLIRAISGQGWVHAIGLEADTPEVEVTGNTIRDLTSPSADKVAVWFESNPSFATARVNYNNFEFTAASGVFGIAVHPALSGGSVDGRYNFWGCANGPGPVGCGNGALVSPLVTFKPWLKKPVGGDPCKHGKSGPCASGSGGSGSEQDEPDTEETAGDGDPEVETGDAAEDDRLVASEPLFVTEPNHPAGGAATPAGRGLDVAGSGGSDGCNLSAAPSSGGLAGAAPFALVIAARMLRRRRAGREAWWTWRGARPFRQPAL